MREQLRGYAAAVLAGAREAGTLPAVHGELGLLAGAVLSSEALYDALVDGSIPVSSRRAVVEDLLAAADRATVRLASEVVAVERPGEVPATMEWLVGRAGDEVKAGQEGRPGPPPDPPAGRTATRERLDGFATALFQDLEDRAGVDEVEDELFRFARTVEGSEPLRAAVTSPDLPVGLRQAVVSDLLAAKVQPATLRLVSYTLATTRARGLVELLDWLVDRAAAERGLRVAQVRAAVGLSEEQRGRLAAALSRTTGRQVELRVTVDPSLIGGIVVLVGDTVIDGSVRNRLDQLRSGLSLAPAAPSPAAAPGPQS